MNNSGMKVLLVILVVVCLFQGCTLASMSDEIDNLNVSLENANSNINRLEWRIDDLESMMDANRLVADITYGVGKVDWEQGVVNIDVSITVNDVAVGTAYSIGNGYGTWELARNGSQVTGTIALPLNNQSYATTLYQYNEGVMTSSEEIDWLGASDFMAKYVLCEFDGMSSYGNGKLTLAGTVEYTINAGETVTNAKLVFGDEELELQNLFYGASEINWSQAVDAIPDEYYNDNVKVLYLEVTTDAGMVFRAYPEIYANVSNKVNVGEESISGAYQQSRLEIVTPAGATYDIIMYLE